MVVEGTYVLAKLGDLEPLVIDGEAARGTLGMEVLVRVSLAVFERHDEGKLDGSVCPRDGNFLAARGTIEELGV